jgi:hypothetical protein
MNRHFPIRFHGKAKRRWNEDYGYDNNCGTRWFPRRHRKHHI